MIARTSFLLTAVAVCFVGLSARTASALPPSDWGEKERIWEYVGEARADSLRDALDDIYDQGAQAATGRFYFGEEMMMARDLLPKYLRQYARDFVVSKNIIERKKIGDDVRVRARVYFQVDRLFNDLKEKRFVYIPKSNPLFYVFLKETIEGSPPAQPMTRPLVESAIDNRGLARYRQTIPKPPPSVDVSMDEALLNEARRQAQTRGIEVLISGEIQTNQVAAKRLYYKNQTFYESQLTLRLIRVDDGALIHSVSRVERVARAKGQDAIKESIELASRDATAELLEYFSLNWAKTIHDATNYRLMLTDVSRDEAEAFAQSLATFDPTVRIYPRNYFGGVAVLNFDYEGDPRVLSIFLQRQAASRYRVIPHDIRRIELESIR